MAGRHCFNDRSRPTAVAAALRKRISSLTPRSDLLFSISAVKDTSSDDEDRMDVDQGAFKVPAIWKKLLIKGNKISKDWKEAVPALFLDNGIPSVQIPLELKSYIQATLREPELTTPPLIKSDRNVELQTTAQQYTFEMLFRSQELVSGQQPTVQFTALSGPENAIRSLLADAFATNWEAVAQQLADSKEQRLLFNFRWYFSQPLLKWRHNMKAFPSEIPDTLASITDLAGQSTASHTMHELGV